MILANEIRIIGGAWRSRKLPVVSAKGLKPTPNRIRETLFNWLMHDIRDSHCLDAFAGSGALGFEALSRGAASVTFCESALKAATQLQDNASTLKCHDRATILNRNFFTSSFSTKFDIVFLDPPFNQNLLPQCFDHIQPFLHESSLIYVEAEKTFSLDVNFEILKKQQAGQVSYYLLKNLL